MAQSIFPTLAEGGEVVRDAFGACLSPPGVLQAYCPPASFTSTGPITYFLEGCASRWIASWANAVMSEMLCLAVFWDPNGNWDFNSLCNLRSAFQNWQASLGCNLTASYPAGPLFPTPPENRQVVTFDPVTQACGRAFLRPYPEVQGVAPRVSATPSTGMAGQTIWTVDVQNDPLTPLASLGTLTGANRGLSLGEVDIPTNRALTIAEMTGPNADRVSLSFRDMQALFTNRAQEAPAQGVMNANGTLGFHSPTFVATTATATSVLTNTVLNYNGATLIVSVTDTAELSTPVDIPLPRYPGQILFLRVSMSGPGSLSALPGGAVLFRHQDPGNLIQGAVRRRNHRIAGPIAMPEYRFFQLRQMESVMLVGSVPAGRWFAAAAQQWTIYLPDIQEHIDGTTTIRFVSPGIPHSVAAVVPIPAVIINPGNDLRVSVLRRSVQAYAPGDPLVAGDINAMGAFQHIPALDGPAQIGLSWRSWSGTPAATSGQIEIVVQNARLDYPAMFPGAQANVGALP